MKTAHGPYSENIQNAQQTQKRSGSMVAHGRHPEKFLFLAFFWKIKNFRFANVFQIKTFLLKKNYSRFEDTFISQMFFKWIDFCFEKYYFHFGNTFTFVSETFRKNWKKSHQVWSCATLRWGPVFPLEKAWFANSPMSMSGSSSSRSYCAYV